MRKLRPRYLRPVRANAGIVIPQFVIHAALSHLPEVFGKGEYAIMEQEECLFTTLSNDQVDSCLHKLQQRPPSVALRFAATRQQLPMITVMRETMPTEEPILGDDAGPVDEDINTSQEDTYLTPPGGALGGETFFRLPATGELISTSVTVVIERGGKRIELDADEDEVDVDSETRIITIVTPLLAGDHLVVTRYATYGLSGGDLFAHTFRYNGVVFIETENPMLTLFLEGIVWRELMLKHHQLLEQGLVDLDFGFRTMSLWEQIRPAIGFRSEVTVSGLVDWVAYKTVKDMRGGSVDLTDTDAVDAADHTLQFQTDLVTWGHDPECGEG